MKGLQYIIIAGLAMTAPVAVAEDELSKEITIEKEIVPEQRAATRLDISPTVKSVTITARQLDYSDRSILVPSASMISTLEPVRSGGVWGDEGYRGYVDAGYFPMFNAAVSAGYRIVDTDKTLLNGRLQYNGRVYDGEMGDGDELKLRSHAVAVGLGLSHYVGKNSRIDADIDYGFSRYNVPIEDVYNQNVNSAKIGAVWHSEVYGIDYSVGVEYGYFGYKNAGISAEDIAEETTDVETELTASRENRFAVDLSAFMPIGVNSHGGVDLSVSHLGYSGFNTTLVSIAPYYLYKTGKVNAKIGAKLDFSSHSVKSVHIAPEIKLGYNGSSVFSIYCCLKGGEHQNSLGTLHEFTQYASSSEIYANSNVPVDATFGINVGKWRGFSMEIFGGYAVANDWLMPVESADGCCSFASVDVKGWHAGISASYEYREMAKIKVSYESAPQKYGQGYYLWRDRAKQVIGASLTVRPVSQIDVTAGYELRSGRRVISSPDGERENLGDMNNLSLGGLYRINSQLSLFARFENLLNNKCLLAGNVPAQGLTGFVGVGYKF